MFNQRLIFPIVWIICQRFKLVVSHENGISLRVGTRPHLLVLFIQSTDIFYIYCAKYTMVNTTNPCLFSCISHFSKVDRKNKTRTKPKSYLWWTVKKKGEWWGGILARLVRETPSEEVIFELRPEKWERPSYGKSRGKSISGQENSMCQGPELGRSRSCSRKRKIISLCGAWWAWRERCRKWGWRDRGLNFCRGLRSVVKSLSIILN